MKSFNKYGILADSTDFINELESLVDNYLTQFPNDKDEIIDAIHSVCNVNISEMKDMLADRKGRRIIFVTPSDTVDFTNIEYEK